MKKVYYDLKTGYLCDRYPKDIPHTDNSPFIEVSEEEAEKTMVCKYGKFWAVRNGKLEIVDDDEVTNTDEYKKYKNTCEISTYQHYLSDTDWVISKLQETKFTNSSDYSSLLVKYEDILKKRKIARENINKLEREID